MGGGEKIRRVDGGGRGGRRLQTNPECADYHFMSCCCNDQSEIITNQHAVTSQSQTCHLHTVLIYYWLFTDIHTMSEYQMERLDLNPSIMKVKAGRFLFLIMHIMIIGTENKRNTFGHVVIHNELELFTAA